MLVTVYCVRRDLTELTFSLEVDGDFELENFRALCELESGIPAAETQIVYAERPLTDNQRSLSSYGLKDGDVVILRQKDPTEPRAAAAAAPFPGLPRIDFSSIAVPGTSNQSPPAQPAASAAAAPPPPDSTSFPHGLDNPMLLREMLLANPHELSLLKERNPPLAEALLSGDIEKFTKVLLEQQQERARREQERIRLFSADPFDLEAQAKIEEDIRQQNIEENMTIAMEEAPESFGQVVMLYINCKVNGYPVKAFVDSGAQMTIMSQACAERCHIMRLVDRRWAGIAKGVGTQKIIGRVHLAQVQIEGDFLPCSFSILEEQPMDMLLGLDMLKRHQCSIDLEKNVLVIGTTGTRTSFLPEGELPECARLAYGPGRDDVHPEEMADRELAEVLQKSAEEADTETTSEDDPSLAAPIDGQGGLVHSPGIDSEAVAPLASAVCSRPSTATESLEPTSNLLKTGAESQDLLSQAGVFPPVMEPAEGEIADDLSISHVGGDGPTEGDLQVTGQPMTNPGHEDNSLPNSSDNTKPLQPVHPGETQRSISPQGQPGQAELGMDALPLPAASCQDSGGEALSGSAEAPMEVDVPTAEPTTDACHTNGPAYDNTGYTGLQEKDDVISCGSSVQVADIADMSKEANGSSKESVPQPLNNPSQDFEENCFSLAAALKELHKLLLVSGKGSCRSLDETAGESESLGDHCHEIPRSSQPSPDHLPQNEASSIGNHSASDEAFPSDKEGHSGGSPDQDPTGCEPLASSEHSESTLGLDSTDLQQSCTACTVADPDAHNDCTTSVKSDQPMEASSGGLTSKSSPAEVLVSQVGANNGPGWDQDHSQSGAVSSPLPPPPAFSPSDIERLVSAGFSLEDAVSALEKACGNVDLALLALLAKNIAVPPLTGL